MFVKGLAFKFVPYKLFTCSVIITKLSILLDGKSKVCCSFLMCCISLVNYQSVSLPNASVNTIYF